MCQPGWQSTADDRRRDSASGHLVPLVSRVRKPPPREVRLGWTGFNPFPVGSWRVNGREREMEIVGNFPLEGAGSIRPDNDDN